MAKTCSSFKREKAHESCCSTNQAAHMQHWLNFIMKLSTQCMAAWFWFSAGETYIERRKILELGLEEALIRSSGPSNRSGSFELICEPPNRFEWSKDEHEKDCLDRTIPYFTLKQLELVSSTPKTISVTSSSRKAQLSINVSKTKPSISK